MLESIKFIDQVFIFDSAKELEEMIKTISPDIMVIGSDWRGKPVIGEEYTKELLFFDRIGDYSTTKILEKE